MKTKDNKSSAQQTENKTGINGNYQQSQINEKDQSVLIDPAITAETDELDPNFAQQAPPEDPEDDQNEEDEEDEEDDFPAEKDLDDDDDLDQDTDESGLDADEDEFELKHRTWNILV